MANILDIRQIKINEGQCKDLYNAAMTRVANARGHCFLCSGAIGGSNGLKTAYKLGGILLCEKCFCDFKDALSLTESGK